MFCVSECKQREKMREKGEPEMIPLAPRRIASQLSAVVGHRNILFRRHIEITKPQLLNRPTLKEVQQNYYFNFITISVFTLTA
jgi:hypothetical protein